MVARLPDRGINAPRRLPRPVEVAESTESAGRHNWLLYVFLFFLPLQNIQTGYMPNLGGGLNFLNIGFMLSLIGAIRCRGSLSRGSPVHKWIIAYVLANCVALMVGYNMLHLEEDGRFNSLKDAMIAVMLVFVVEMSVTNWATLKRVILVTLLPMPYMLRVTWVEHAGVDTSHYKDSLRIQGTFSLLGANEFAAFCVMMAVLLLALLLVGKFSWRWRALLGAGIACMVLGVIWCYSRTAYVTIIVGVLCVLLLMRGRLKMILPLLIAGLVLPAVMPESVTERFQSTSIEQGSRDESTEMRFKFWEIAWEHFNAHPAFGIGYKSFQAREYNPYGMDTHNFFMRELAEKGLFGFLITTGLFLSLLAASWRAMRVSRHESFAYPLGIGMVAAWFTLLVGNFWGDRFTYYPLIGYFWVYLGLMLKAQEFELAEQAAIAKASTDAPKPEVTVRRFAQPRPRNA
ncbi:MAG: O-antigen ligase family protein [Rudaea sp.]